MRKIIVQLKSVLLGTLIVVCFCSCGKESPSYIEEEAFVSQTQEEQTPATNQTDTEFIESMEIYVYVCGQIQSPGVYVLPKGSRICDAFEKAGGFTDVAATDYWNQARVLQDGEMIYVPSKEEVKDLSFLQTSEDTKETDDPNKVNINTASKEELMTLPGIGEAKALAILSYRQENGPFSSLEELKAVEGIKEAVFSKMKEYIEI